MAIGSPSPAARTGIDKPSTGKPLANIQLASLDDYEAVVTRASEAFTDWRMIPARGAESLREIGNELRLDQHESARWFA